MKGLKDTLANHMEIVSHVTESCQYGNAIEIQGITNSSLDCVGGDNVQIEKFCRIVSMGVNTPFPRSQQQLAYAVIGIKKALKAISLVELLYRRPEVTQLSAEAIRPEVKPIKLLDSLLKQTIFKQSLPNLARAARFMHEKDQQDILRILQRKMIKFE